MAKYRNFFIGFFPIASPRSTPDKGLKVIIQTAQLYFMSIKGPPDLLDVFHKNIVLCVPVQFTMASVFMVPFGVSTAAIRFVPKSSILVCMPVTDVFSNIYNKPLLHTND